MSLQALVILGLNSGRIFRFSVRVGPVLPTLVQYLVAVCNRPEGASDVMSSRFVRAIVLEKFVKFGHHRLNRSREILPEAVGRGIFDSFFRYNIRPEADNNVISGVATECVGMDIRVKLDDSRSNGVRDIRGTDFVSNERT